MCIRDRFYDEAVRLGSEDAVHELPDESIPPDIRAMRDRSFE